PGCDRCRDAVAAGLPAKRHRLSPNHDLLAFRGATCCTPEKIVSCHCEEQTHAPPVLRSPSRRGNLFLAHSIAGDCSNRSRCRPRYYSTLPLRWYFSQHYRPPPRRLRCYPCNGGLRCKHYSPLSFWERGRG